MIKDIVFDFGGVLTTIDTGEALRRFKALGVAEPEKFINPYCQKGLFFALENGDITAEQFCAELGKICNRTVSHNDAKYAWLGFIVNVQEELLQYLQQFRPRYRLSILSNTNPFIQSWACSNDFTAYGKPLDDFFDKLFFSYRLGASKPNEDIYRKMLLEGKMKPEETLFIDDGAKNLESASKLGINTLKVENGEDWRTTLEKMLDTL